MSSWGGLLKVRLPKDISDEVDEDPTGNKALWDRGLLSGASQKVDTSSMSLTTNHCSYFSSSFMYFVQFY